jgi:hypothetical protein
VSKIKTLNQLQIMLDKEFAWRLKEIADLKFVVKKSEGLRQSTAIRAGIPLLYAHWEGFVKNSATYYLDFVNGQNLKYEQLKSCFVVFGVKKQLNDLINSKTSEISITTLDFLRNELCNKAKLKIDSAIRTESNLSSKVFSNITTSIGLDTSQYESRYNLIDESLLNRRNHIAHGEYLDVEANAFSDLADEILVLLRMFKTDIENAATLGYFKLIA